MVKRTSKKGKNRSQPKADNEEFITVDGSPASGITLRRILRGHEHGIKRIAWSPDGRFIASPSQDRTFRIWDLGRGECVAALDRHKVELSCVAWSPDGQNLASASNNQFEANNSLIIWDTATWEPREVLEVGDSVFSIAWSPDGKKLARGSSDMTIRVWETETWETLAVLKGHGHNVTGVAWSSDGRRLASVSGIWGSPENCTVRIWDSETWIEAWTLEGHSQGIYCVVWVPNQPLVVSGACDNTIRLWDALSGKQVQILEAHTGSITSLSFSSDGTLFASRAQDKTVRLWRVDTWETVAILNEITTNSLLAGLAFHPNLPCLATLGEEDRIVRIWELDTEILLSSQAVTDSARYTAAKLVLVGDSGVGKTGLGWRLAHGEFREQASTHGQQFWVIEELKTRRKDGTECEAVLWDLAGQAVYRPVHAIFLDDVDLSLVLIDPTNRAEPLKGAQFWLEQLAGREKRLPPSVLVGARTDRGEAAVSREELEQFCQRYGISGGYISTSAKSGAGLERLLETIKEQIPWERMTTTVTTVTFKRVKEYVLSLKEKPDRRGVLVRPAELRGQLEATDAGWEFTDAEMMTAVKHLETHGYVLVLRSSSGEEVILLTPELLVDLASSVVLQADKHPQDLGAVSETELLKGAYNFPELAALEQDERQILLDAAVVRFMSHNICFREALGSNALLIFPTLIKQKRPLFDEVETAEDVSYVVRGRVENVYAALVVLLGYTQSFTRVNQWQNQAQYQMGEGQICGFRLIEEREGEIELVIYYSAAMPAYGRTMFQGTFEQFLYPRDVEVARFPPVACPNSHRQERAIVVKRIRESKAFIFCDECGERVALPEIGKPLALGAQDTRRVRREEALARLRSTYETHLTRVKAFRRDRTPPRYYLSRLPERAAWAAQLARDLSDAGVFILDDPSQVQASDFILLAGTRAYGSEWGRPGGPLAADAELIRARLGRGSAQWPTVIPLLLEGDTDTACPRELRDCLAGDFRDSTRYAVGLFDLVLTLYAVHLRHPAFEPLREDLQRQWLHTLSGDAGADAPAEPTGVGAHGVQAAAEARREVFISYAWGGESEEFADRLDRALRERGVAVVRDKRDLGYKGDIKQFMERIGRGRCVVLVISDKYLKSENCLFELLQVADRGDFAGRVFPVVLGDARIYKPVDRVRYVRHWEQQLSELDAEMKTVSAANLQGLREDIDLYAEIRARLPRLADILKNMNALTPERHAASDFAELFEAVVGKLSE